jgi:MFS family permease
MRQISIRDTGTFSRTDETREVILFLSLHTLIEITISDCGCIRISNNSKETMTEAEEQRRQPLHVEDDARNTVIKPHDNKNGFENFLSESVWPGLGLLGESYMLFSIGTLKPIFQLLFPECFRDSHQAQECSQEILTPLTYSVVIGVISGMLLLGFLANKMGRRRGSICTASLMCFGAAGLTASACLFTDNPVLLFQMCSFFFAIFGVGVGGEYPLAAASASERSMGELKNRQAGDGIMRVESDISVEEKEVDEHNRRTFPAAHNLNTTTTTKNTATQSQRGQQILLVFTMQGVGIFINSLLLSFLFLLFRQGSLVIDSDTEISEYSRTCLLLIWRLVYALGTGILFAVLYTRILYLKESTVWEDDKNRRDQLARNNQTAPPLTSDLSAISPNLSMVSTVSSLSAPSVAIHPASSSDADFMLLHRASSTDPADDLKSGTWRLILRNYGVRLWGVSMCWMLWDGTCRIRGSLIFRWIDAAHSFFSSLSCILWKQTISK